MAFGHWTRIEYSIEWQDFVQSWVKTVYTHPLCHALLFQCIFASEYSRLPSLLRDGPLEKLLGGGGGEFSSRRNFFRY